MKCESFFAQHNKKNNKVSSLGAEKHLKLINEIKKIYDFHLCKLLNEWNRENPKEKPPESERMKS